MKSKTFQKKLTLNKSTIAQLEGKEMKHANGGWEVTSPSNNPYVCCIIKDTKILCP